MVLGASLRQYGPMTIRPPAPEAPPSEADTLQAPSRRKSGRPGRAGPAVGRDELVRRCVELLDTLPAQQLTFSALARHAGVTPALITYYFRDKSDLQTAVLRLLRERLGDDLSEEAGGKPMDQLRQYIRSLIGIHIRYPYFHDLLYEEMIKARSPSARELFEETTDNGLGIFARILEQGFRDGSMRRADPLMIYVTVIGMCAFTNIAELIISHGAAGGDHSPPDRFADAIFEMAKTYLLPDARSPA
jgi:AcrR family transcriptional regulator